MLKNSWKYVSTVTLICVIIISVFLSSKPITVEAQPPTYFTLEATTTFNIYWGYYGGYYEIWLKIQPELAKIGIDLTIQRWDDYEWWDQVWENGWNSTGDNLYDPQGEPPSYGGWDVTMLEWWLQPHALEPWFASMVLNNMTPYEEGFNIHPWMNPKATRLLWLGVHSFDAQDRKDYLWAWQKEWMHDPPIAEIYYPRLFELMGSYVVGYDPSGCWWYDIKHLDINNTKFEEVLAPGGTDPNPDRYAVGNDTLKYAVSEPLWNWNPMFMDTYTEESVGTLCYDTLYTWSLDYTDTEWRELAGKVEPNREDYIIKPELAAGDPIVLEGGRRMRVPLKNNVTWSDGVPFNATDVKYTFDITFTPKAKNSGVGDYSNVIASVEYVDDPEGVIDPYTGYGPIDPYMIDFILYEPHPDFTSVIANDWGGGTIMPWHSLHHILPQQLKGHATNTDYTQMVPGTGPFTVTDFVADSYIKLERNPLHWGYADGYGPHVSTIFLEYALDAGTRKTLLLNNDIDFGEYPIAQVDEYYTYMTYNNVRVFQYDYPSSNGVWFNFNNPYLSNRYVRQAFAHTIPYDIIYSGTLVNWGVESVVPGIAMILPCHYYTDPNTAVTVHLFNENLLPCEYDIAKATQYLNMWLYSQPTYAPAGSAEVAQGPVGDADFSGRVNYDDFWVWRDNSPSVPGDWSWLPGMDIDPDFNNDEVVDGDDFIDWTMTYGNQYPFAGAR